MDTKDTEVSPDTGVILEKLKGITADIASLKEDVKALTETVIQVAVLKTRIENIEKTLTVLVGAFITAAGAIFVYLLTHGGNIIP